jgi:UDP-glucose 4,6-dehydratase
VYFLGGVFNSVLDKSYLWNDPILNIDWPSEAKNAIISLKDLSNPTFNNIDTIILGHKGYIGKHILKHVPNSIGIDTRLENVDELRRQISILKPKYIISAAGISGKPTIDWCESHKSETIFTNVTCQLNLINLCKELNIHLTIIGSGAVFNGDKLFTEEDEPNFTGTFYSKARSILEGIIRDVYAENVLYLRLLYPITCDGDPMCFVEKLKTRSSNIHNTKITVTILPLLLPNLQTLLQQKITGILNFVNDGITSPSELLNICNVNHIISSEKTNRGLCCLDVSLLKKYTRVENFAELHKIKM